MRKKGIISKKMLKTGCNLILENDRKLIFNSLIKIKIKKPKNINTLWLLYLKSNRLI